MAPRFRYPIVPAPRVALVGFGVSEMALSDADAVAAPARILINAPFDQWVPTFPVIAFTGLRHGFLTEDDRDRIWRRWGVPVFEQLLSSSLDVIAEECEAHEGLHLLGEGWQSESRVLRGELETKRCRCGKGTPRIMNVRPAEFSAAACA